MISDSDQADSTARHIQNHCPATLSKCSREEFQSRDPLPQAQLHRVVARLSNGDEIAITAERTAKRTARAVDRPPGDGIICPVFTVWTTMVAIAPPTI